MKLWKGLEENKAFISFSEIDPDFIIRPSFEITKKVFPINRHSAGDFKRFDTVHHKKCTPDLKIFKVLFSLGQNIELIPEEIRKADSEKFFTISNQNNNSSSYYSSNQTDTQNINNSINQVEHSNIVNEISHNVDQKINTTENKIYETIDQQFNQINNSIKSVISQTSNFSNNLSVEEIEILENKIVELTSISNNNQADQKNETKTIAAALKEYSRLNEKINKTDKKFEDFLNS